MLPFLKPKPQVGLIIENRKPDGNSEKEHEDHDDMGLEACSEDLIRAVHAKDAKSVAAALRAAFEICEAYPHEEGPHINEEEESE